jgi:hypothetical protein
VNWWSRLAQNRLLDAGALVIAALAAVKIAVVLPKQSREYDFAHYYVWSRLLIEGRDPYLTRADPLYAQYGFLSYEDRPAATNPPLLLWMFVPFTLLTPSQAFAGWSLVQALSLCVILWWTRRLLQPRLTLRGWRFVCAGALASQAVYLHFCVGQVQLLLAALLLTAYGLQRRGQGTAAGLLAMTAGLLKMYPLILLPWFLWRSGGDVRARIVRALLVLAVSLVVIWITNIQLWRELVRHALPVVTNYAMGPRFNFSLPSFVATVGNAFGDVTRSGDGAHAWWTVGEAAGLAFVVAAYIVCARRGGDVEAEFCLLCITMLAGNLVAWGHYFVLLIFPMAATAVRIAAKPSGSRIIWFGSVLIAINVLTPLTPAFLGHHWFVETVLNYIPLYGVLVLAAFLLKELWMGQRRRSMSGLWTAGTT